MKGTSRTQRGPEEPAPAGHAQVLVLPDGEAGDDDDQVEDDDDEEDEDKVVACAPWLLLEATTTKGIEISLHELQVEVSDPVVNSGATLGDRGILVRGRWKDCDGEYRVDFDTIERAAQQIDDLDMM